MLRAFSTAATGMAGQQTMVDVIANNLANVNTSGFKRNHVDFKDLFGELVTTIRVSEAAKMEYLRKSLDSKLLYIVRDAKDLKEAWRRMDEHFVDRAGSIKVILKNLMNVDASKGRSFKESTRLRTKWSTPPISSRG